MEKTLATIALIGAAITFGFWYRWYRQQGGVIAPPPVVPAGGTPKKPYFKEHPWKSAGWVVTGVLLLPVAMWLLALAINWMKFAAPASASAVAESINGPQGHTQVGSVEVRPASPLKSLGGPLRWSDNAKAKLRGRASMENVHNGVCFVGIIPPSSWLDTTLSCYATDSGRWGAFLINTNGVGFLPEDGLSVHAVERHGVLGTAFRLDGLTGTQMKHATRVNNETALNSQTGFRVNEMYVQTVQGGPSRIQVDQVGPPNMLQYEVEIGANETSFVIPQSFKWLWIAPVHHGCYQSRFLGSTVPSTGMYIEEAEGLVQSSRKPKELPLELGGDGYHQDLKFQAILLERNGVREVLSQAVLLQASDVSGTMSVRLNIPRQESFSKVVRPARIIVGIQM